MSDPNPIVPYAGYSAAGKIMALGRGARDDIALQSFGGFTYLEVPEGTSVTLQRIVAGAVAARAACPVAAAVAGRVVTFTGVPIGAPYTISGAAQFTGVAADATLVLTFGAPGTYAITIDCFPAQDYTQQATLV